MVAATMLALIVFSEVALAATLTCQAEVACFGTKQPDTLNGSEGVAYMFGKGRGDTLNGFGGNDNLYGEGGPDKLFGGPGVDELTGGPGIDALSGGEDADVYHFKDGWGKDTITDSATSQNKVMFGSPLGGTQGSVTEDLIIKLLPGEGPEVKNASGTNTINWAENNAVQYVYSGSGDDQITGNAAANSIHARYGADTISAGGGNDDVHVADGVGDDVVDCGESGYIQDTDTVYYDSDDQIAPNCETQNLVTP